MDYRIYELCYLVTIIRSDKIKIMAAAEDNCFLRDASITISTQKKSFVWNYFGVCVITPSDGPSWTYMGNKIFCLLCLQYAQKHSKNEKDLLKK